VLNYSRSEIEGQKQRRWQWRGAALALGIVADWRPLPGHGPWLPPQEPPDRGRQGFSSVRPPN